MQLVKVKSRKVTNTLLVLCLLIVCFIQFINCQANKDPSIIEQSVIIDRLPKNQQTSLPQQSHLPQFKQAKNQTQIKLQYKRIRTSSLYHQKFITELNNIKTYETNAINATKIANGKEICQNGNPCDFFYYIIQPIPNSFEKVQSPTDQNENKKQNLIRNILLVSGMHGNEYIGPLSLLYSLRHLAPSQTRIIIFPLANPSGFDYNRRETYPVGIDPNRDFPIQQYSKCYQASSTLIIDKIFRSFSIDLTIALHNGQSQIGWNWGTLKQKTQSHTENEQIYREIGEWLQSIAGSNKKIRMDEFRIGTMNQVVYPVEGSFDDWAYAGSWYEKSQFSQQPNKHPLTSQNCKYQPYPQNMSRSLVFLFELGPFQVPQELFGSQDGLLANPESQDSSNGYISRTIRMLSGIVNILNPRLSLKFTNSEMVARLSGCKKGVLQFLKVTDLSINNSGCLYDSNTKVFMQGNINTLKFEPSVFRLQKNVYNINQIQLIASNNPNKLNSSAQGFLAQNKLAPRSLIIDYNISCDPSWQDQGKTVFSKQRKFAVKQRVLLIDHQMPGLKQTYFNSLNDAIAAFKFTGQQNNFAGNTGSMKQNLEQIGRFLDQNQQMIVILTIITIVSSGIMFLICIIGRQLKRDLKKRKIERLKFKLQEKQMGYELSSNEVSFNDQTVDSSVVRQRAFQSGIASKPVDSYPQMCESDKGLHSEQLCDEGIKSEQFVGQIVQLQQFVRTYSDMIAKK